MENVKAEEEVQEALAKLDRQRKSIILRSFFRLLIPIGATIVVTWYSSTIIGQNRALKAGNIHLEATNANQAQTIKRITDNYFEVTGKLGEELAPLKATNAEQAQTIKRITDHLFKVTGELNSNLDLVRAQNASLKATSAGQAQTIKQITDNYFKVTGELNDEIVFLREENAALRKELQKLRR